MQTNFLLGTLKLTESARMALKRQPFDLIARHAVNEHGLITAKERASNERSMKTLGPILSRYKLDPTNPRSPNVLIYTRDKWDETLVTLEQLPISRRPNTDGSSFYSNHRLWGAGRRSTPARQ